MNLHEKIDDGNLTEEITLVLNALRFSEFKSILRVFKFMPLNTTPIDKLNLMVLDWLEIAEIEIELINF